MKIRFLWRALKARYRDQSVELKAIQQAVVPNTITCDIGANKGSYLYWLSRWVQQGHVYAFEPQPSLAIYLQQICAVLKLNNVTVEEMAVSDHTGTCEFYVPETGNSPSASICKNDSERNGFHSVEVNTVSLDDYFQEDRIISVIKIDVEGAELGVFQGAKRILTQQSPLLLFECEGRHLESNTVFEVFEYLNELGYSGKFVCGKTLIPLSEFKPSVHQKQDGDRFWDHKDYCSNFIFTKDSNETQKLFAAG